MWTLAGEADLKTKLEVGVEEGPEAGFWEGARVASLVRAQMAGLVGGQEHV